MSEPRTEAGRRLVELTVYDDPTGELYDLILAIEDEARADERRIVSEKRRIVSEELKPLTEAAMRMARDMARADLVARIVAAVEGTAGLRPWSNPHEDEYIKKVAVLDAIRKEAER